MAIELSKQEIEQIVPSIRKYLKEELGQEIGEMQARFLLDYVMKEIAPFAYNKGVSDAEAFLRARVEDLPSTCFEEPLSYWRQKRK